MLGAGVVPAFTVPGFSLANEMSSATVLAENDGGATNMIGDDEIIGRF